MAEGDRRRVALPGRPPEGAEAVRLGSAPLGAVARGDVPDLMSAMATLSSPQQTIEPADGATREYHERKHRIFHRMHAEQLAYRC